MCSCGQLAPKRKAEVRARHGHQFFPNSPSRQFSSLPSSPSHRRTERGKAGGSSDIYLEEKHTLYRDTGERQIYTLYHHKYIRMGQTCSPLLSLQEWMQHIKLVSKTQPVCLPERRGMKNPKEGWRCQVWGTPESGILLNGNFSAFQHCLTQDHMNCLFNTVFWELHTWCTQHSVGIEFNSWEN